MFGQKKSDDKVTNLKKSELEDMENAYYSIYKKTPKNETYYINLNDLFYVLFDIRARQILDEQDLIKLNKEMSNISFNSKFEEHKKKLAELMNDYNNILAQAKKECDFNKNVLQSLMFSVDKISDKIFDANEKYEKICDEIVKTGFNNCIKYEKKIINLRDKVQTINKLFNDYYL